MPIIEVEEDLQEFNFGDRAQTMKMNFHNMVKSKLTRNTTNALKEEKNESKTGFF